MLLNLFNIIYVLVAIAMIALILLQRGSGAQAGSGFGGGASGTVFGARGATTFLSRSTALLAALFFLLSLTMAWYLGHAGVSKPADDLGVMSGIEAPKVPAAAPATAPASGDVPTAPAGTAPADATPTSSNSADIPAVPTMATEAPAPAAPAKKNDAPPAKPADAKKH